MNRGITGRAVMVTAIVAAGVLYAAAAGTAAPKSGSPARAGKGAGAAQGKSVSPQESAAVEDYTFHETTLPAGQVARVGSRVVTEKEVRRRVKELRSRAGLGHDKPLEQGRDALRQLVDEGFLVDKLRKSGYDKDARVQRMRVLYEKLFRANHYERDVVQKKVTVSDAEIDAVLPRSREERHLQLLLLADPGDAEGILREAATGVPFAALVTKHSRTGEGFGLKGDLGFQQQRGVYFAPEEENYLWSLPVGAISRVVETKIGPALVTTVAKRTVPEATRKAQRAEIRANLLRQRVEVFSAAIVNRHKIVIDENALSRSVAAMLAEDRFTDAVVGSVDGLEVRFHDVDRLLDGSFQDIFSKANLEELTGHYRGFLRHATARLALAGEAEQLGLALNDRDRGNVRNYVDRAMLLAVWQDAGRGVTVSEEELRKEYDAGIERFLSVDRARLGIVVAANLDAAKSAREELEKGVSLALVAAKYSRDAATVKTGGEAGWQEVAKLPEAVAAGLPFTAPGEFIPFFQTPQGVNLVLVLDKGTPKTATYELMRSGLRLRLLFEKRLDTLRSRFTGTRAGVRVDLDSKQLDAASVLPAVPSGAGKKPHGSH